MSNPIALVSAGACLFLSLSTFAQDVPRPTDEQLRNLKSVDYSRYPQQNFPNQVYFGETHLHTSFSTDAGMIGNTLGPDDAFRIARGDPFVSSHGFDGRNGQTLRCQLLARFLNQFFDVRPNVQFFFDVAS